MRRRSRLDELRRGRQRSAAIEPLKRACCRARARQGQSRSARARARARTAITSCARSSSRSSCTTRCICAARPGTVRASSRRTAGVCRSTSSNLVWKAAAPLWNALGRGRASRATCRSRSRSRFRWRPVWAAAARTPRRRCMRWPGCGAARRSTLLRDVAARHRRRRAVFSVGRHRARAGPRRRDLSAGRPAGPLGRDRPAAVRRVDGGGLRLVRRGPRGRAAGNRASCRCCRCPGRRGPRRWSTTSSRRSSGAIPRSGDIEGAAEGGRGGGGGDVRQRIGGFRPVSQRGRPRPGRSGRWRAARAATAARGRSLTRHR